MVKNKDLPDSAAHPQSGLSLSVSVSVSLSLSIYLPPSPFILRVPPGSCRGWTPAGKGTFENYMEPQKQRVAQKKS